MSTPLYTALRAFADTNPLRMHMPGHKGKELPLAEFSPAAELDFTELPPTGNLFAGEGPIVEAQRLWAKVCGVEECLFLTGGSTQGVLTALTLACRPGDVVLMDRGCHRSAYHALVLLDLEPVYLFRPWLEVAGVPGPMDPAEVDRALTDRPDIRAVFLTSPTYYGVRSDLPAIAQVCRRHGAKLVVDGAHGAHFPFLGISELAAADLAVLSAHKTLPAPGQAAVLLANGYSLAQLCRAGSVYGSSSPSYPIMAALDAVREALISGPLGLDYVETAAQTALLRQRYPSLTPRDALLDPTRFVLRCDDGFSVKKELEKLGIYPEMADIRHVVFILTCADGKEALDRLTRGLDQVLSRRPAPLSLPAPVTPPQPQAVLRPREAFFSSVESLPLRLAEGRVCAAQVAPYPPGVPVIAPGELVTKKTIAYLAQIGYNMEKDTLVVRPGLLCGAGRSGGL